MKVDGKTALVTGAGRGIGRATAELLLRRGCKVCLVDNDEKTLEATRRELCKQFDAGRVRVDFADVADDASLDAAFQQTVAKFGGLDIVVNNAGIMDEINYIRMMLVNLGGVIRGTELALKYMSNNGVIVNIGSITGIAGAETEIALKASTKVAKYTAVKAGVVSYSRCMAVSPEVQDKNIRVCCLCPCATVTELLMQRVRANHPDVEEQKEVLKRWNALEPEVVADKIVFLAEEEGAGTVVGVLGAQGSMTYA